MPISRIKTDGIQDDAVTSAKIGVNVIVADDLAANSVTVSEITNGAVTSAKLDTNIAIAGNLTVDTNTLYVDATNNNVGIGTASPAVASGTGLQIHNAASGAQTRLSLTNNSTGSASSDGMQLVIENGGGALIEQREAQYLGFATSASERMRIDSNGNVGIGTSNPASLLHIKSSTADVRLQLTNSASADDTTGSGASFQLNNDDLYINAVENSGNIVFRTDGGTGGFVERMRIFSNGNVTVSSGTITANRASADQSITAEATTAGYASRVMLKAANYSGGSFNGIQSYQGDVTAAWEISGGKANVTNVMALSTGGTERMRIDSSGRLLVGATVHSVSSSQKFEVQGGVSLFQVNSSSVAPILVKNTDQTAAPGSPQIIIQDGGGNRGAIYRDSSNVLGIHGQGGVTFHSGSTAPTTERMRIESNGEVAINVADAQAQLHVRSDDMASARDALRLQNAANNTGGYFIRFTNHAGSLAGYIEQSGANSVTYATSSDYRLKENIVDLNDATTRIKQLKPKRFNFITEPNTTLDGFLAHEVQDIVPEAIRGTKDAVDSDGNPQYQGIDQSKLVPLLVKTIQELEARITALESN